MAVYRKVEVSDAQAIADIYNHYVQNSFVTFEEEPVSAPDMADRIAETTGQGYPWLVVETAGGAVSGYAYASRWKQRVAYRNSCETTVYLDPACGGRGLGTGLYERLLQALGEAGYHLAIGGISLPNPASVALHEKMGFEKIGQFREVGFKFDQWIDVGYWQRIITRDDG